MARSNTIIQPDNMGNIDNCICHRKHDMRTMADLLTENNQLRKQFRAAELKLNSMTKQLDTEKAKRTKYKTQLDKLTKGSKLI